MIFGKWFELVRVIIAKYGITKKDIYNFDETGFLITLFIVPGMVIINAEKRGKLK